MKHAANGQAGRTVILSDTHIGKPGRGAPSAAALRPLWHGASRLILNGDVAEVHDPQWRARAAREVLALEELCEKDGVDVTILSGNHDPMISDRRFLSIHDGAVFITHGDILHPAISPWNSYAPKLQSMHEQTLSILNPRELASLETRLAAVQHVAHLEWDHEANDPRPVGSKWQKAVSIPVKAGRVLWYWSTMHWRAYGFMLRHAPEAQFFVFGHYHHSGIWRMGKRIIINTGSYCFPAQPLAVVTENQTLTVYAIRWDGQAYHLREKPRAIFQITEPLTQGPTALAAG